jgi:hypothetical protein
VLLREGKVWVPRFIAITWLALVCAFAPAQAEKRVALVIGIDRYTNLPDHQQLRKAVNDARAVGDALKRIGFEVVTGENLDRGALVDKLDELTRRLARGDAAFFFYSGHGVALDGVNYVLPADVPDIAAGQETRLRLAALSETDIIAGLTGRGVQVAVVVLDACRTNPFTRSWAKGVGGEKGLAPPPQVRGVFSLYAASGGQAARDQLYDGDSNPNSVFTRVLVPALTRPGIDLTALAFEVREEVARIAHNAGYDQRPAYYDETIGGRVYLNGAPPSVPAGDEIAWNFLRDFASAEQLRRFIAQFPESPRRHEAEERIRALERTNVAVTLPAGPVAKPAGPTGPAERAPMSQKVVLYEEDPANPNGMQFVGTALWRTERDALAPGQKPEVAIRGDIEIPEQKVSVRLWLRRNADKLLPASHTVEVNFSLPAGFSHGGIASIPGIMVKQGETNRGTALNGVAVKVTDHYFLVGLSLAEADMQRNLQLLKGQSWLDIPIVYGDGKRAFIAIEKGPPGERAFSEAFAAWEQVAVVLPQRDLPPDVAGLPAVMALQRNDPAAFDRFKKRYADSAVNARKDEEMTLARNALRKSVKHLLAIAPGDVLLDITETSLSYLQGLQSTNPETCVWLSDDNKGARLTSNLARDLPIPYMREMSVLERIASTNPHMAIAPMSDEEARPYFERVLATLRRQNVKTDLHARERLDPSEFAPYCALMIAFYQAVLDLPRDDKINMLRNLYAKAAANADSDVAAPSLPVEPKPVHTVPIRTYAGIGVPAVRVPASEPGKPAGGQQTVAVAAPTPPLNRDEINAMLVRARTFLSGGDVAAARVVLRRAAVSDSPEVAIELGGTYDPTVLKKFGTASFHADPAQAREWYRKAAALGSADAAARLEQLPQ